MSGQNSIVPARRVWTISAVSALALLVFVAAFDNQWTASWRSTHMGGDTGFPGMPIAPGGNSWTSTPILHLSALSWRVSPASGESGREFAGSLVGVVLTIVLTVLLIALVARGLSTSRGRWSLFLGAWAATSVAAGIGLVAGMLLGGNVVPLGRGTVYYLQLGEGFEFGLFLGWLIGLIAVLVYSATTGMEDLSVTAEYNSPSGYDYGSAIPASYSYGGGGNESGPTQTAPVQQPYDPYGNNRAY